MTQWWNGDTKDTTVRRKRVVMGREFRGVLLLVALAALAAADAFSTDSKSAIFFSQPNAKRFFREARQRALRGARGVGGEGELVLKSLASYTPSCIAVLDEIRDLSTAFHFWQPRSVNFFSYDFASLRYPLSPLSPWKARQ